MRKRILSFKYAIAGIATLVKEEPNARIHLVVAAIVVGLGVYFDLYLIEWLAIAGCIGMVSIRRGDKFLH